MIHVIIGTRAQLVKMAPLLRILEDEAVDYHLIFTGQHQATFDDIRGNFFSKKPDLVLYEGKDITSVPAMFAWAVRILLRAWLGKVPVFGGDKNGLVLIHGDTFSCLLGGLLAKTMRHRVAHVESGLRSHNLFHPFPEELTRIATFCLTDIYFCPGSWAVENLRRFKGEKINTENNTLFDALVYAVDHFDEIDVDIPAYPYCVVSVHRFENVFQRRRLFRILKIVESIATKMRVLFVMHPPTEKKLRSFGFMARVEQNPNIAIRPRTDYFKFIKLVYNSEFLVTDGGSNQEETYYMGKPCLLLRKATERNEGLGGNVVLSKYDPKVIDDFVENYAAHKTQMRRPDTSPSRMIFDYITPCDTGG